MFLNVRKNQGMEIENIAFSGGGVKALAFCGAVRMLEKTGIMKGVKRIVGTSAGSLIGLFLACGFTSYEIVDIVKERDFSHLKDNSSLMENVHRFVFYYGFYSGDLIDTWISEHFEARDIHPEITFEEVYARFGKDFIVTGTHLNQRKTVYFSRETTPKMPVKTAVRISTSIPLFFEPIEMNGNIYVDGGLLCNYPIGYFEKIDPGLEKTIGFNAVSTFDTIKHQEIRDVFHVIDLVLNTLTIKADMATITELHNSRTVTINTKDVNTTDFNLKEYMKDKLFGRGYRCTKQFLQERMPLKNLEDTKEQDE